MGRGEEDGGFFDCYLQRLSFSRMIGPQQQQKHKKQQRNLIFNDIFSLSGFTSLTLVLFFSPFSVASISVSFFIRVI